MFWKSAVVVCLFLPVFASDSVPPASELTVHEWGTFTSVAGEDGAPVSWVALAAPSDLPCFDYRLRAQCVKCKATSMVRMETPVVYFYSQRAATVSVHVDLPSGLITEWYPRATGVPADVTYGNNGAIEWTRIQVMPGAVPAFPYDHGASHYYAARNTGAAVLEVDGQREKMLFYRGIADAGVALEAQALPDGGLRLRNRGSDAIPFVFLFENRGGKSGYRVTRDLRGSLLLDSPELTADVATLHRDLASALTAAGLFPDEAAAMTETWRDSWFEEGMRVFYILPRAEVDSVLPLKVAPAPSAVARVFVGRVEVLSPAMRQTIEAALATGDIRTLAKCSRFLGPFLTQITRKEGVVISPAARSFIDARMAELARNLVEPCKEPVQVTTN